MNPLRVAVIVPCYDDGELVVEAVRSIDEPEAIEVVVVDDGSSDALTLAALERLSTDGVRLIRHNRNRGAAVAKMTGLAATRAPYAACLDADDLAVPGSFAAMANRLDASPEAAVCYGHYAEFGAVELVRAVPDVLDPYRIAYTNEYPALALFRRSVLDEVGGWRAAGYQGFAHYDWNLWMTLAERGSAAIHAGSDLITYRRRVEPGSRRLGAAGRERHRELYREMRCLHPRLFADLGRHRRNSDMSLARKLLYPLVYGGRPRFAFERRLKPWLDRLGIWTLRR